MPEHESRAGHPSANQAPYPRRADRSRFFELIVHRHARARRLSDV